MAGEGWDPGDWHRIEDLFHAAVALPPPERRELLASRCGADRRLRAEVDSLVRAYEEATGFLQAPSAPLRGFRPGDRLGRYTVLRQIADGGMGAVYLAARADQEFRQKVAIKVIRRGVGAGEQLERFRQERQILADLRHPFIAGLLDGGTTGDGRPFVVMEHIEGCHIDVYCDRRRLPVRRRIELFLKVCAAVEHAHRALVVHRDIKPTNILVTDDGTPRLLDFGIAKLLGSRPEGGRLEATEPSQRPMTLLFASPEQVRAAPATTATDVYSLGVLLYLLLTGRHPYRPADPSPRALERAILEAEPLRPSAAVLASPDAAGTTGGAEAQPRGGPAPAALHRRLRGDLDAILLKALRKDPGRRYGSVELLARDLRRFLEGRPVTARRGTLAYRAAKFAARHRMALAAGGVAAALLAGAVVGLARSHHRAVRERDRAREVTGLLVDLFRASDPAEARGREVSALERGALEVDRGLRDQPELRADLADTLGRVYLNRGELEEAERLLRLAHDLRVRLHPAGHPRVAASLHHLGLLAEARGDYGEAAELLDEALTRRRRTADLSPRELVENLLDLASVRTSQGLYREAEPLVDEAVLQARLAFGEVHPLVARCLLSLAEVAAVLEREEEPEALTRRALEIYRGAYEAPHPALVDALQRLAAIVRFAARYDEAEELIREVTAMTEELYGAGDPRHADALNDLGDVLLVGRGEAAAAEELFRRVLRVRRRELGEDHPEVAVALNNLAQTLRYQGRYAEAADIQRRSTETLRRVLGEEHLYVAFSLQNLGSILREQGALGDSEAALREALAVLDAGFGEGEALADRAMIQLSLGETLRRQERLDEAGALAHRALAFHREHYGADHDLVADSLVLLAGVQRDRGDPAAAELSLREAVRILEAKFPAPHPKRGEALRHLADLLLARGDLAAAAASARSAVEILGATLPPTHPRVRAARELLAACSRRGGAAAGAAPPPLARSAVAAKS